MRLQGLLAAPADAKHFADRAVDVSQAPLRLAARRLAEAFRNRECSAVGRQRLLRFTTVPKGITYPFEIICETRMCIRIIWICRDTSFGDLHGFAVGIECFGSLAGCTQDIADLAVGNLQVLLPKWLVRIGSYRLFDQFKAACSCRQGRVEVALLAQRDDKFAQCDGLAALQLRT